MTVPDVYNQQLKQISPTALQNLLAKALSKSIKATPYTAQITREAPCAIVFLIDQSGSMKEMVKFQGNQISKADAVAEIVNKMTDSIIARCKKNDGIRNYFDIAMIGYGGKDSEEANFLWQGNLERKEFITVSELNNSFLEKRQVEIEKNIRGVLKREIMEIKTWIKPIANYKTPMKSALELAEDILKRWIIAKEDRDCYPPVVFNITDGAATDASDDQLLDIATKLKTLHTIDGHLLLFNIHLGIKGDEQVLFPSSFNELSDSEYAKLLYNMSSEMPQKDHSFIARLKNSDTHSTYVAMAYNAGLEVIAHMLDIGTPTNHIK